MRRAFVTLLCIDLVLGAIACGDTPVTPKSQCSTGSTKAAHKGGKTTLYECHNNEWIKVDCLSGTHKSVVQKGVSMQYVCRFGRWVKE